MKVIKNRPLFSEFSKLNFEKTHIKQSETLKFRNFRQMIFRTYQRQRKKTKNSFRLFQRRRRSFILIKKSSRSHGAFALRTPFILEDLVANFGSPIPKCLEMLKIRQKVESKDIISKYYFILRRCQK